MSNWLLGRRFLTLFMSNLIKNLSLCLSNNFLNQKLHLFYLFWLSWSDAKRQSAWKRRYRSNTVFVHHSRQNVVFHRDSWKKIKIKKPFLNTLKQKYNNTVKRVYNGHPWDLKKVAVLHRCLIKLRFRLAVDGSNWPLLTGGRCSQVAVVHRWSVSQVWLYSGCCLMGSH